jgi:hypothetical protein
VKPPRQKAFNDRAAHSDKMSMRPIATKAELIARLRARLTPKVERALEPHGHSRNVVKSAHAAENEKRITVIRERLLDARTKLRSGFARSKDVDRGR